MSEIALVTLTILILTYHQVASFNFGLHAISPNSFLTDALVETKKRRSSFSTFYVFFLWGGGGWGDGEGRVGVD